uniref:Arginine/serine-rich splicing factor RS27 transcript II n=1 Tax=Physcomitrium patens TaxID=3218 RepID=M1H9E2_PHYPA|nr:arginine/serine-rich splicing factor RS27 transcript II [Physcomitrium patens]
MAAKIRPVYCGNFEYDARQSEIERLFKEYGRVERVDMKTGMSMKSMAALLLAVWLRIFHYYMAPPANIDFIYVIRTHQNSSCPSHQQSSSCHQSSDFLLL